MTQFSSIDEVMASYPGRFHPEKARDVDGVIQFLFTGEGGADYYMRIESEKLEIEEGTYPSPTLTVTVRAEDWLKVNNEETNPMGLLMQGRLKIRGSLGMAGTFQAMFTPGSELDER